MTKRKSESLRLGLDPIPWQSLDWSLCGRSPDEATEHSVKSTSCAACPVLLQKPCEISGPWDITRVGKSRSQAASEAKFSSVASKSLLDTFYFKAVANQILFSSWMSIILLISRYNFFWFSMYVTRKSPLMCT